eukprot:g6176.t1
MVGRMNVAGFFGVAVALAGSVGAQTCTGGIAGVQSTSLDVCCVAECGTCGGPGCTPANTSSLTANDCCATEISDSGVLCSDTGVAPCILSTEAAPATSLCDNGQTGIQDPDTDVCCPLECGSFCGGEGCGTIPGVDASLCCAAAIIASGVECDGTTTPCVQTSVADAESTCSNGFPGVETDLICCDAACGICGGDTCGNVPGLTGADCCLTEISEANELCSVKGSAPCVVDPPPVTPSTCPNGIPGVADGNICCAEACNGVCGGVGCGVVPGTNGPSDCCSATIAATGTPCGEAPCVMGNGTFTPSPVAPPTMAPGATVAPAATAGSSAPTTVAPAAAAAGTPAPTAGSRDFSFTMAPTAAAQTASPSAGSRAFGTGVPTAAPTSIEDISSSAPTAGSRDFAFSAAPSGGPTFMPFTFPPGATLPPELSGAASLSAGSVVTTAAMVGGLFAAFAAARN